MTKLNQNYSILALIFISLIVRILAAFIYADTTIINEWSDLINNYETSGKFGQWVVESEFIASARAAKIGETVLPSVYMPPLYYYFIFSVKVISSGLIDHVALLISFQIILSLISIYVLFKIIKTFAKFEIAIIFSIFFSLFPLNIYSSVQVSSVTLQVFLITFYIYFILQLFNKINFKNLLFFSIFSGLLILIRGEFFIFYFIILFYIFFYVHKNLKFLLTSIVMTLLIIAPYLKRNYDNFNTLVLTKSFGYNLLKGNNPEFKIEGNPSFIAKKYPTGIFRVKTDNNYEINIDNRYKEEALIFIKENPLKCLHNYILKVFSFTFIDFTSTYPNYFNFLHLFPKIILSILSFFGAILALNKKSIFQFLSLFYFSNIFLFSVFFILPRYSLMLLPVQILLTIKLLQTIYLKIFRLTL